MDPLGFVTKPLALCDTSRFSRAILVERVRPFPGIGWTAVVSFLVGSIIFIVSWRLIPAFRLALSLEVIWLVIVVMYHFG